MSENRSAKNIVQTCPRCGTDLDRASVKQCILITDEDSDIIVQRLQCGHCDFEFSAIGGHEIHIV